MSTQLLVLTDSVAVFILILVAGCIVYLVGRHFPKSKAKVKPASFNMVFYLKVWGVALACGLIVSWLNPKNELNVLTYFLILFLLPYALLSNRQRKFNEQLFYDVILYTSSVAASLKTQGNVYVALNRSSQELGEPLRQDVFELIDSLADDKVSTQKVLDKMAIRYPYTIIRQLNILIIQMHYESNISDTKIIKAFQDDIEQLNRDVKQNQAQRKVLRMQYLALTGGCMVSLWLLIRQLEQSLNLSVAQGWLSNISLFFYLICLVLLFFVDQYFNTHMTRE